MILRRNKNNKVVLVDLAEGNYGRKREFNPVTASEIMKNPKSTRYVPLQKFEDMESKRERAAELDAEIAKREGNAPKSDTPEQDIIDTHNRIVGERVDGDERLTNGGFVKKTVLIGLLKRDVLPKEHLAYIRYFTAMQKKQENE